MKKKEKDALEEACRKLREAEKEFDQKMKASHLEEIIRQADAKQQR